MTSTHRCSARIRLGRYAAFAAGIAVFAASLATAAFASPGVGFSTDPQLSNLLVDDRGMTLYRFTPDQPTTSTCYDACAAAWPPLLVDAIPVVQDQTLASGLGITTRNDGTQQLTYNGAPLYLFVGDAQPGDTHGQGSGGVWFVVNPAAGAASPAPDSQPAPAANRPAAPATTPAAGYGY